LVGIICDIHAHVLAGELPEPETVHDDDPSRPSQRRLWKMGADTLPKCAALWVRAAPRIARPRANLAALVAPVSYCTEGSEGGDVFRRRDKFDMQRKPPR